MENFKRSAKRFFTKLTVLALVVICGAVAISRAQKQNKANAADTILSPEDFASSSKDQPPQGPIVGLPVQDPPGKIRISDARPLPTNDNVASLGFPKPQQDATGESSSLQDTAGLSVPDFGPPANEDTYVQASYESAEDMVPAPGSQDDFATNEPSEDSFSPPSFPAAGTDPDDFIQDKQVVQTQATDDRFSNRFGDAFPSPSAAQDDGPEPPRFSAGGDAPRFGNNDASMEPARFNDFGGAPSFGDAPEFTGDAPTHAGRSNTSPPASDFNSPFPSSQSRAEPEASRFASQVDSTNTQSHNRLRQPTTTTTPGELPAPTSTTNTALAQPASQTPSAASTLDQFAPPSFGGNASEDAPAAFGSDLTSARSEQRFADSPLPSSTNRMTPTGGTGTTGAGLPAPELNGTQSATISVQKSAPTQAHIDEPVTFRIQVRNNGTRAVERVMIRDQVPQGAELVSTEPQAKQAANGIYWEIDTLNAGEERSVSMQVLPSVEQTIGSVAEVSFTAMASAQVEVRQPMLKIEHTTEPEVMLGDTVRFAIVISNPGTGTAKNVTVEEDVPQGLSHSKGPRLDYPVGDIPPGGRRRLELSLKAAEAGSVTNIIRARGGKGLQAEHQVNLQVVAPDLKVAIDGPATRYLERKATYTVELKNQGTAAAQNINLRVQLPRGLKFVSTESKGLYDSSTHSVRWLLRALEAQRGASVTFTVDPQQKGDFAMNAVATADRNLRDSQEHSLTVEGIAALLLEVVDQVDPIEVGGITTYNIRVTNQGTKAARDVEILAQLPPGLEAVVPRTGADYQVQGDWVGFKPITSLAAKDTVTYAIQVRGLRDGDQRFRVQMKTADKPTPVTEEESTTVYSDQ